jgi:hypothetical protein
MEYVYLLQHSYEYNEVEEIKTIGIYSTEETANIVIEKYKKLPGFKDYPDGFNIDKYKINSNSWKEGFVKWDQAL